MKKYVKRDGLIYELTMRIADIEEFRHSLDLYLVCGYDYTENGGRGLVGRHAFIDTIQHVSLTYFPMVETITERLTYDDFTMLSSDKVSELGIEDFE